MARAMGSTITTVALLAAAVGLTGCSDDTAPHAVTTATSMSPSPALPAEPSTQAAGTGTGADGAVANDEPLEAWWNRSDDDTGRDMTCTSWQVHPESLVQDLHAWFEAHPEEVGTVTEQRLRDFLRPKCGVPYSER